MRDLRLPGLAVVVWGSAVVATRLPVRACAVAVGLITVSLLLRRLIATAVAVAVLTVASVGGVAIRTEALHTSLAWHLAADRAAVVAVVVVAQDPRAVARSGGRRVAFNADVVRIEGRGRAGPSPPVRLTMATNAAQTVSYGGTIEVEGRMAPARDRWLAGAIAVRGAPRLVVQPDGADKAADAFRAAVRNAVRPWGRDAGLVPGLVDGDETLLPAGLDSDFRATSLTHLLAVSGTNLTLLLVFVLALAKGIGLRARAIPACGALTVVAFVVIARAEPSVIRAAAMGVVTLLGLGTNGLDRGLRALSACIIALVLFDPRIALSLGFTLSAAATAAILLLGPGYREALASWLPSWLAEALAVPLAAEIVCAPIVATISGQVSLVGVVANAAAGPAVGPATVFGMGAGLIALASKAAAHVVALPAVVGAHWIIAVAHAGAAQPMATVVLPPGALGVGLLAVTCVVGAFVLPHVLRRRWAAVGLAFMVCLVVLVGGP